MHSRNTTRSQNHFLGRNSVSEKSVRLVTVNAHGTMNRTGASPPRLLVECKHWNKAVGTDEIGAFIADLQDAKLTSGIVLSRRGGARWRDENLQLPSESGRVCTFIFRARH